METEGLKCGCRNPRLLPGRWSCACRRTATRDSCLAKKHCRGLSQCPRALVRPQDHGPTPYDAGGEHLVPRCRGSSRRSDGSGTVGAQPSRDAHGISLERAGQCEEVKQSVQADFWGRQDALEIEVDLPKAIFFDREVWMAKRSSESRTRTCHVSETSLTGPFWCGSDFHRSSIQSVPKLTSSTWPAGVEFDASKPGKAAESQCGFAVETHEDHELLQSE